MANKALGLIEVHGMLGAVLAADAALKAANVELLGNYSIRGGLTTVELLGDVAAVYAAVEAGVDSVKDMNLLISSHVIPRLDDQVERMLMKKYEVKTEETEMESLEEEETQSKEESTKEEEKENSDEDSTNEDTENPPEVPEETELEEMKVVDLRSLAYKRNIEALTKKEIKYANKAELIRVLVQEGMEDK